MGDAQSAQREGRKDETAAEEEDAQAEISAGDKLFKNNGQICEVTEKAGSSIAQVNGHCEDEIAADAVLSPDEDVAETENPLEVLKETPSKHDKRNENETSNEADVAEDTPLNVIEMDAKKNDINDGFRRFFSNIGLKLSIKRGSTELLNDLPDETNIEERSGQDLEDSAEEIKIEDADQITQLNTAQETIENDSTTCPTLTDVTPEDVPETVEEKATEAKEEAESDNVDGPQTSPTVEDPQQDGLPEDDPNSTSSPGQEEAVSPIKRFFTTGIFSGLRKKRKLAGDEMNEKEMVDLTKKEAMEMMEEIKGDEQEEKEQVDPGVEVDVDETEQKESKTQEEIPTETPAETTDEGKPQATEPLTSTAPETENQNSQEKDKVQASPLRRLLSGSSFKKLAKKPRSRRSSDARLSDSGEHAADQLQMSTESAENQTEEVSTQPSTEAAVAEAAVVEAAVAEEEGTWASLKKLLTPKKHTRTPSLTNKEAEVTTSVEEPKPNEGEQISDHSTEEGKKRKDSSVSWEAVLCGSGKKRSRKTSDSEEESPQADIKKQEPESKNVAESTEASANEKNNEMLVSTPKQSPSPSDGGSTWRSFKRLVTPKRKAKDEDENKENVQSDGEVSQDESSFSFKKLLSGRKKRKPAEKQDHVSSDEADKEMPSVDEDSETPAVVPLSEFDTPESVVQIQTLADIENHIPKEVPQDLLQQTPEPSFPCDSLQNEAKKLEESDLKNRASKTSAKDEETDDVSEAISKHQQLSDITEEGIITETMATPDSIHEEAGKDDTIAEDLIEITSEAITAPEPAWVTAVADETEMISAVSQLSSESSKTSGNTTPVPAEYEVKETEALLHQVVETITTSPKAVPISSSTPKSESIVGSVLHQIFRTFVKEKEPKILEIHKKTDATAIKTGETIEDLDAVEELAATAETESMPEITDSKPTECVPEVLQRNDFSEMTVDEVHEEQPTHPEPSMEELGRINEHESQQEVGSLLSEGIALNQESTIEESQAEMEAPKMETEKTPSEELKEETELTNEVQVDPEKVDILEADAPKSEILEEDIVMEDAQETEAANELKEDLLSTPDIETVDSSKTELVKEPEVSQTIQAPPPALEMGILPSVKEEKLENVPEVNTVASKEETDMRVEPEELPLSTVKSDVEDIVEETQTDEVASVVQAPFTDNTEEGRVQETVQESLLGILMLPQKEIPSEDLSQMEEDTDEPQPKTDVKVESEEELPLSTVKSDVDDTVEDTQTEEVTSVDKAPLTDNTEEGRVQEPAQESLLGILMLAQKEIPSEDLSQMEEDTDEPQPKTDVKVEPEEKLSLSTVKPDVESSVEDTQTEEVTSVDEAPVTDSNEEGRVQEPAQESLLNILMLSQKEIPSEDLSQVEKDTDEPQPKTDERLEPEEELPLSTVKSDVEDTVEDTQTEAVTSVDEAPVTDSTEEGKVQEPVQESLLSILQQKEIPSEDLSQMEDTDEPQPKTGERDETEDKLPIEVAKTENVQEPEVLPSDVEDTAMESKAEAGSMIDKHEEMKSIEEGSVTLPLSDNNVQPEDAFKIEVIQEPQELQTLQPSVLDSLVDMVTDVPKNESEAAVEAEEIPPVKDAKTKDVQETEVLSSSIETAVEKTSTEEVASIDVAVGSNVEGDATVPLDEGSVEQMEPSTTEQMVELEELPKEQKLPSISDESNKEADVNIQPQEMPQDEAIQVENVQEPEAPPVVKDTVMETLTEEGLSIQGPEVTGITEEVNATMTVIEESLEAMESLTPEKVKEQDELQTEAALLDSEVDGPPTLDKELSEDVPTVDTVIEESQEEIFMSVEAVPTEVVQEPDVQESLLDILKRSILPQKKTISKALSQEETEARDEPEDKLPVAVLTSENIQESELLPPGVEDTGKENKTEEGALPNLHEVKENTEKCITIPVPEVQEPEVLQTEQALPVDSKTDNLVPLEKVTSEDILTTEIVTEELKEETEMRVEIEENLTAEAAQAGEETEVLPSDVEEAVNNTQTEEAALSDKHMVTEGEGASLPEGSSETEPLETKPVQEPEVQESLLGLLIRSILPDKKEASENLLEKETDKDEPQPEIALRDKPEEKLQTAAETTEPVQELEVLPSDRVYAVKGTLKEDLSLQPEVRERREESDANIPLSEGSLEPVDHTTTEQAKPQEDLQTVQKIPSDLEVGSLLPAEVIPKDIPEIETVMEEPQKETEAVVETVTTENVQEPEVLISDVKDMVMETSAEQGPSVPLPESAEVEVQKETETVVESQVKTKVEAAITKEPHELTSTVINTETDTSVEGGAPIQLSVVTERTDEDSVIKPLAKGSFELADASETEHVQEPEAVQTVQVPATDLKADGLLQPQEELEDILTDETPEPILCTEGEIETEEKITVCEAAHESVAEQDATPSDEDSVKDIQTDEVEPSDEHLVKDSAEGDGATTSLTEGSAEPVEPSKTEHTQKPEAQESLLGLLMRSILPHKKEPSEDLSEKETDMGELQPQENVPAEAKTIECSNEPEVPPSDIGNTVKETAEEVTLTDLHVIAESTEEGDETKPSTDSNHEAPDHFTAEHVDPKTEILAEDIPAPENVTDGLALEAEVKVELKEDQRVVAPKADVPDAAEELQPIPQVHVSSEESNKVQVPEKTICTEEIQVQVVDVKSSETAEDKVLEVVFPEIKEVCHKTDKEIDGLSLISDTGKELVHEETMKTDQEVIKHAPELVSESEAASEEAVIKQPDAPVVVRDDSGIEKTVSEDQTPELPVGINIPIDSHRENLEETKAEILKAEVGVPAGHVKSLLEEFDGKKVHEPALITQSAQGSIAMPSNAALVVPQNTGIVSSMGNVETPSSLSLEFKLNIQFNQTNIQPSSPTTERTEPTKKTDVSDVGVQAVETVEPVFATQSAENHKLIEQTEVNVQPTDTAKPKAPLISLQRAVTLTQPVVGTDKIEMVESAKKEPACLPQTAVEPGNLIIPTQGAEGQNQTESTVVSAQQTEITGPKAIIVFTERAVITTQPVVLDVGVHAIETVELVSEAQAAQPQITESMEPTKEEEELEVVVTEMEALEPLNEETPTQSTESQQVELTETSDQLTELVEQTVLLDSTEKASTPQPPSDRIETAEQTDVTEFGFPRAEAIETEETVQPEGGEGPIETDAAKVDVEPAEVVELTASPESAEGAVETTKHEPSEEVLPSNVGETVTDTQMEVAAPTDMHVVTESAEGESKAPTPADGSAEPVDPLITEPVQEPEVKESLFGLLMRSILPHKKVVVEDSSQKETVADEAQPKTEARDEPEELPADTTTECVQEPEELPPSDVEETVKETTEEAVKEHIQSDKSEKQMEPAEIIDQPTEITEAKEIEVEGAMNVTQPELVDDGPVEAIEPEVEPALPSSTVETDESVKPLDVLEIEIQAMESVEAVKPSTPADTAEIPEVNDQSTEETEPEAHLDSTEAVPTTQPELLDEPVKPMDASQLGAKEEEAVEIAETIIPMQRVESPKHTELPDVEVQQLDVGMHEIETVEQVAIQSASPPIKADECEPLKQTYLPEVKIQAEEVSEKPIISVQISEIEEQMGLTEANAQATELTEPAADLNLTERAVIGTPVVLGIGIHPEPESNVEITETLQPESQMVQQDEPQLLDSCDEETKEENEQDVWMDAEEGIYTQEETEMSFLEVEEPEEELEAESVPEEEAHPEEEAELTAKPKTEEEESQQEEYKTGEICEIESDSEDFAIALEHQEFSTATISILEWD